LGEDRRKCIDITAGVPTNCVGILSLDCFAHIVAAL
jgi:hypothetical protein